MMSEGVQHRLRRAEVSQQEGTTVTRATLQSLLADWTRRGERPAIIALREPDLECRLPRLRRISVIFGRPVQCDQLALPSSSDEVDWHIAEQLRNAVAALARDERNGL